jgi:hypothetical protein
MLKKMALIAAATASTFAVMPVAAQAQYYGGSYNRGYNNSYSNGYNDSYRTDRYGRTYTYDRYGNRVYVNSGSYGGSNGYYGQSSNYYGRNSGYYDQGYRRCSGTTGTIIGGVAGALLGREVGRGGGSYYSRGGSGTTGAILGGAVGALAGRSIDKSSCRNR